MEYKDSIELDETQLAGDGSSISIAAAVDGYLPKCSGPYTFKELGTPEVTLESNKNITEMISADAVSYTHLSIVPVHIGKDHNGSGA